MNKKNLMDLLGHVQDEEEISIVVQDVDEDDPVEDGDILDIQDVGFARGMHVIRVAKT